MGTTCYSVPLYTPPFSLLFLEKKRARIMCIIRYPLRYMGLICTVIGVLILSPLIYLIGGCVGTYEVIFPSSDSSNSTSQFDQAIEIIKIAYSTHEAPAVFHKWGLAFLIGYIVIVLIVGIICCAKIVCECGREMGQMGETRQIEMASLRSEYEERSASVL